MMLRAATTVVLLIASNIFMTWAWYGHLKRPAWPLLLAIAISWMIALPEYLLQVPANRIGHFSQGGPFTASQLKVIQEAITLMVFIGFAVCVLRERPRINEYIAFGLILLAVVIAMLGRREEPPQEQVVETPPQQLVPTVAAVGVEPETTAAHELRAHGDTVHDECVHHDGAGHAPGELRETER